MSLISTEKKKRSINTIIKENSNNLFHFIRSRTRNTADAEDILQDVWLQLSSIVDLENIEQIGGWLFRVARNRITDSYRKKSPELTLDDEVTHVSKALELLMAEIPDFADEELKSIFWNALFEALDELPEDQRNAFIWNELEDKTFREIEENTGVGIKTWISRKGYAIKHLRSRLEALYIELLD